MGYKSNSDEIEIDVRELFEILVRKWVLILTVGILAAVTTMAGTKFFVEPQYESVTKMYVLNRQNANSLTYTDLQTSLMFSQDFAEIIKSRTVMENAIKDLNLDMQVAQLSRKIDVSTTTNTRIVTIKITDTDPQRARDLADAIREAAAERIRVVMNYEAVNVVDVANLPSAPVGPSVLKNGIIGGILGCLLVIGVLCQAYVVNDTIQTPEDVERYLGLSTLGEIPLDENGKKSKKKKKMQAHRGR